MKNLFILSIFFIILKADILHITSDKFFYDSKHLKSVFIGDVNATKNKDNILSDKMIIYFNKHKKPIKYIAKGHVRFILSDKTATYKGHCNELIYDFLTTNIYLLGNAYVKKIETNESLSGNEIILNRKNKSIEVKGGKKKPVNIIIKVNE